jgi:hypothetical protein
MAKPNYSHARRQREAARKARQDERLARRRPKPEGEATEPDAQSPADAPAGSTPSPEHGK